MYIFRNVLGMNEPLLKTSNAFPWSEYAVAKVFNIAPWRQRHYKLSSALMSFHLAMLIFSIPLILLLTFQVSSICRNWKFFWT